MRPSIQIHRPVEPSEKRLIARDAALEPLVFPARKKPDGHRIQYFIPNDDALKCVRQSAQPTDAPSEASNCAANRPLPAPNSITSQVLLASSAASMAHASGRANKGESSGAVIKSLPFRAQWPNGCAPLQ